jgi:hypothetical protein
MARFAAAPGLLPGLGGCPEGYEPLPPSGVKFGSGASVDARRPISSLLSSTTSISPHRSRQEASRERVRARGRPQRACAQASPGGGGTAAHGPRICSLKNAAPVARHQSRRPAGLPPRRQSAPPARATSPPRAPRPGRHPREDHNSPLPELPPNRTPAQQPQPNTRQPSTDDGGLVSGQMLPGQAAEPLWPALDRLIGIRNRERSTGCRQGSARGRVGPA